MNLSSDQGFTALGVLIPAIAIIQDMAESTMKNILLGILLVVTGVIGWRTTGSGISPEQGKQILDTHEDIQELLKKGRE